MICGRNVKCKCIQKDKGERMRRKECRCKGKLKNTGRQRKDGKKHNYLRQEGGADMMKGMKVDNIPAG
jgi:hypothetical protein